MRVLRTFPVAWSLITSSSPAVTQFTQLPFTTAPLPSHTQTQTEIEHTKPSATPHQNSPIAHALTTATLISRTYTPQTAPVTNTVPPKTSSTATFGNFNERETKMMAVVMAQCTKAPVEIDFQKLADAFGLKNAASARTAWHGVKKKIEAMNQQDDGDDEGGETAANTGKKRKADDFGDDGAEEEADEEVPEKKKKGKKGKKAAAADAEEGDEAATDASNEKKNKGGKKGKKAAAKVKEEVEDDDDA